MLQSRISKIFITTKLVFAGQIVNNNLNPVLLAIGASCYRIQSHMLHIPDRFGFFSPSLPRLQVHRAGFFLSMAWTSFFVTIATGFSFFLPPTTRNTNLRHFNGMLTNVFIDSNSGGCFLGHDVLRLPPRARL
jgi:hypothetical protein